MTRKKKMIIFGLTIILFLTLLIVFINKQDKYSVNEVTLKYRIYDGKKWSFWSKNGKTIGNLNDSIKNIEISIKPKNKGSVSYSIYDEKNKKFNQIESNTKTKYSSINGISVSLIDEFNTKYRICYRTYNKKNKWMNWSCDGVWNGNAKENINKLEIKVIPRNCVLEEWLKNYDLNKSNRLGF